METTNKTGSSQTNPQTVRGAITAEVIQTVRDASPIEQVVAEQVELKRAGSQYTGRCPFHLEKTPSFFVHPTKGVYKCWGCDSGGDVFTFIEKFCNLSFPQAVARLALRAGIEINGFKPSREQLVLAAEKKAQRDEETAFQQFVNDRIRQVSDECYGLARAATRAERCLRAGILRPGVEQDLAWSALERYLLFQLWLERSEPLAPEVLSEKWEGNRRAAA